MKIKIIRFIIQGILDLIAIGLGAVIGFGLYVLVFNLLNGGF